MRSSLLTGLTGVVAVLVLAYVGLTAMDLQPHITFGDPARKVASADGHETVTLPAPLSTAPVAPPPANVAPPPVAIDKPPTPALQPESPPSVAASPQLALAPKINAEALPNAAPGNIDATREHAGPPFAAAPANATSNEATGALTVMPKQEPSSPLTPPVIADVKPDAPRVPEQAIAKSGAEEPPQPSLSMIPTPEARPEPPKEEKRTETADASTSPEKPAADAQLSKPVATPKAQGAGVIPAAPSNDAPKPASDAALKPIDLSRPLAERAGVLTIGNRVIRLVGIEPTDPARICTGEDGKEWPCGALARTALRAFLLGRTVTCDVPDPQWTGPVTAACRFARVDLSEWLARNGWAEPAADSPLAAAANEARTNGLGIYGNDPRKRNASTLAPAPPKEDPLNPI